MKFLILAFSILLVACGKTLPITEVNSLSGKSYGSGNGRISLIKDMQTGHNLFITESIKVSGGMFFTIEANFPSVYGAELFYLDDSTGEIFLVADITPGEQGSEVSNFSDPGGDYVYFLANTNSQGHEIFKVHKATFVVTELPAAVTDGTSTFNASEDKDSFIVLSENPLVAYGRAYHKDNNNTVLSKDFQNNQVEVLFKYVYSGSGSPTYSPVTKTLATSSPLGAVSTTVYFEEPKFLTRMYGNNGGVSTAMLSFVNQKKKTNGGTGFIRQSLFAAIEPTGVINDYSNDIINVKQIVALRDGGIYQKPSIIIADKAGNPGISYLWNYDFSTWVAQISRLTPLDCLWNGTSTCWQAHPWSSGYNITEMIVHNDKLFYVATLSSYSACNRGTNNCTGTAIGQEVGVYNPLNYNAITNPTGYDWTNITGLVTIDLYPGNDISTNPLSSGPAELTSAGDQVCLRAHTPLSGTEGGAEIVCIDQDDYTTKVFDYYPGDDGAGNPYSSIPYSIKYLTASESLVFVAKDSANSFRIASLDLAQETFSSLSPQYEMHLNESDQQEYTKYIAHQSEDSAIVLNTKNILDAQLITPSKQLVAASSRVKDKFGLGSINDGGLPLLRFEKDGYFYVTNFLNQQYTWKMNPTTGAMTKLNIGGIISDKYLEDSTNVYLASNFEGYASLVILNKTTGASTIVKKSCFDNGSAEEKYCELLRNDLTDAKVNGDDENVALSKSLQLMMIHQGYLFYLARTKDAGNTDSDVRLFRYKISDGSLAHLDDIPLNPKLVAYTDNAFILTGNLGSGTPATAILRISSDGGDTFNYVNINQSSVDYELEMVSDFHQIGNEVFIKGRKNTGVYYDLFKIDLDTILTNPITAVVKMNETHSINATAATAASLALLKTENGLGLIKKDEEYKVYNTNTHVFDSVLQTTLSASKFNGDTYIIAGSNYYVYDTNGTLKETESLVGYNTFCSSLPDQVFLTKNLIVQHCGTSDMGIHLRSNKSFIDLAALGYNWSTNETRMKVLYEDTKRTIISIERAYSSNPTYYDSKIIEIEADSAVLNFLVNKTGETQDNFKYPVAEGSYLRCENTGSGYNNLVYYDLKNGTVDEIDNTYECINDGSFRELTKTFDNGKSFNILLRKIGIESTKGWELYNVKI